MLLAAPYSPPRTAPPTAGSRRAPHFNHNAEDAEDISPTMIFSDGRLLLFISDGVSGFASQNLGRMDLAV